MYSDWTTRFFDGLAVEFWVNVAPPPTETEIDLLRNAFRDELKPVPALRLLDIACGAGRYSIPLAAIGYQVSGIDISDDFLEVAREHANIDWHRGDIRELPWKDRFDGALCFGNSFGYFPRDETRAFLRGVATALKRGARFVLETSATAESLLPSLQRERRIEVGEMIFSSVNRYEPAQSRLDVEYTFVKNGARETKSAQTFVFTTGEVAGMLTDAGFEVEGLYGSAEKDDFTVGSPRAIFVARRIRAAASSAIE